MGVDKDEFEGLLSRAKRTAGKQADTELSPRELAALVRAYKSLVRRRTGRAFPQRPEEQLWGAITAVFRSWNNARARRYRRQYAIPEDLGTAVNVQCMVFGNLGEDCATGVAFTRNPATGENVLYGEYLPNAQGEDVVAGIRTPLPISKQQADGKREASLEARMPRAYAELQRIRKRLERHYRDMQDVEFTIERGTLYMLQTRTGKRTGMAALHIAFDLNRERMIGRDDVVRRIDPDMLIQLLAPVFDPRELERARREDRVLARGLPAGPGAATGAIAFSAERAEQWAQRGTRVLLVRAETSPEDIGGMAAAAGILTSRGGMTSHAAVVARGMGKPCIVGAESLRLDEHARRLHAGRLTLREGDLLSIDGTSGEVIAGELLPHPSEIQQVLVERSLQPRRCRVFLRYAQLMRWADRLRRLRVRTNADTPTDSKVARAFGAEGIGLCRTEHMFFDEQRILAVRQMILADDDAQRARALARLLPEQRKDFVGIFTAMAGLPVTIRLLDPPLHEFLPTTPAQFRKLARAMGLPAKTLQARAEQLREANPMLGHRGCRLGITFPAIYEMQVRAIFEAAAVCAKRRIRVLPEVMIPLVGTVEEFRNLEGRLRAVAHEVERKARRKIPYMLGTMVEVPRACLVASQIAADAEFFSFGTNDLTQMVYGFSRDDVGKFLPAYLELGLLPADPFRTIDSAVGRLVRMAIEEGRRAKQGLKVGVCGEHGGDAESVKFFHHAGADYVSCSPYRVPVARLAAAQSALEEQGAGGSGTA
jgi:pyruvate,orthophosphate dikinase